MIRSAKSSKKLQTFLKKRLPSALTRTRRLLGTPPIAVTFCPVTPLDQVTEALAASIHRTDIDTNFYRFITADVFFGFLHERSKSPAK